jgi:TolB protein
VIHPLLEENGSLRLTHHPAADYHPAWSPQGRQIAFVSNRSGESEIWVADLDQAEADRFINISRNPTGKDDRPAWSPNGSMLVWSGVQEGFHNLYLQEISKVTNAASAWLPPSKDYLGSGDWPVWSPDGSTLLTVVTTPNQTYLTAYPVHSPGLALPPIALPGTVSGLATGDAALLWPLRDPYRQAAQQTPTPLWEVTLTSAPESPDERFQLIPLDGVEAPHAMLHDAVDESFQALQQHSAEEIGWDFLSTLENAFVPLTSPLSPGMGEDWLYTGRAFAFTTLPVNAGWIAIVREDFGSQTYWRIYLRARYQDGSVGIPLHDQPWDFNSRFSGDTSAYEQGGQLAEIIPPGYWVDFTSLALSYGWERLPALSTWRSAYPATRFNEFAFTQGLNWRSAMLHLYPPEVLITPTVVVPSTRTPTPTPRWYQTPTPSYTPTPRPTFTQVSPTPSRTPTSTATTLPESPTPGSTSTRTPTIIVGTHTSTPTP